MCRRPIFYTRIGSLSVVLYLIQYLLNGAVVPLAKQVVQAGSGLYGEKASLDLYLFDTKLLISLILHVHGCGGVLQRYTMVLQVNLRVRDSFPKRHSFTVNVGRSGKATTSPNTRR